MILFRFMSNTYSGITQKVFAIIPESLFDFDRNRCSICSGMTVRFAPEFTTTLYGIAAHDKHPPKRMTAEALIHSIFNNSGGDPYKWLAGARIHHRDLPWSVAYGKADAAIILYHLGLFTLQTFPDIFDVVPLGGTIADPHPLEGTIITTRFLVRIKGNWSARQLEAREGLVETLLSDDFSKILGKRGLLRPQGFIPMKGGAH